MIVNIERAGVEARSYSTGTSIFYDPEDTGNFKTDDPLGGNGRVYFHDENGHLFEATY